MAASANAPLTVKRGDTHTLTFKATTSAGAAVNLSGRTYLVQVRQYPDTSTVAATYSVDTSNASTGTIVFTLAATTTAAMTPGPYRYDIQETNGSVVRTPVEGAWTLSADVSRSS
jgi:hypothetical protein